MPIYEYVCHDCTTRFEKLVRRFGEDVSCPSCAGEAVEKQMSVFAVASSMGSPAVEGCGAGACGDASAGCGAGACGGGACGRPS